jgi:hypothetical protein
MPTWLIILLCLPAVLWLAYCLLRWSWGLPACLHCLLSWTAAPGALGLWMLWSGWSAQIMPRLVIGATILVCTVIIAGVIFLAFRFGGRRKQTRQEATADAAVLGTLAVAPLVGSGSKVRGAGKDSASDDAGDIDADAGGLDI